MYIALLVSVKCNKIAKLLLTHSYLHYSETWDVNSFSQYTYHEVLDKIVKIGIVIVTLITEVIGQLTAVMICVQMSGCAVTQFPL